VGIEEIITRNEIKKMYLVDKLRIEIIKESAIRIRS
jgi:hypothetical protein